MEGRQNKKKNKKKEKKIQNSNLIFVGLGGAKLSRKSWGMILLWSSAITAPCGN